MRMPLLSSHAALAAAVADNGGRELRQAFDLHASRRDLHSAARARRRAAQNNCVTCHSVDYINTQPPNRGKAFWEAEVTKMIKVYHAPINDADAMAIADYLAKTY